MRFCSGSFGARTRTEENRLLLIMGTACLPASKAMRSEANERAK